MTANSLHIGKDLSICIAVFSAGTAWQLICGDVPLREAAWPVNIIIDIALVAAVAVMHSLRGRCRLFSWLGSARAAVCSIACAVIVVIALGLIRPDTDPYLPWWHRLLSSWPFALVYLWITVTLGLCILRRVCCRWTRETVIFTLNHLGLWIVLVAGASGAPDLQQRYMYVGRSSLGHSPQWMADAPDGTTEILDFAIGLDDFDIEYHPDGSPGRYTSHVTIYSRQTEPLRPITSSVIEVNHPIEVQGWQISQYGYEYEMGAQSRYSVFQLVRDPWLPFVYAGIYMMLAGAACLLLIPPRTPRQPLSPKP